MSGNRPGKKPVKNDAGCVVLSSVIYTGYPFTVKIVRDPAYAGVWSRPTVNNTAVFAKTDGGSVTITSSETISKYGLTYVNTTMHAPACNGTPCEIAYLSEPVNISATVTEPINKGKKTRKAICTPAAVPVYQSM